MAYKYGGMDANQFERVKELVQYKKIDAELAQNSYILKGVIEKAPRPIMNLLLYELVK